MNRMLRKNLLITISITLVVISCNQSGELTNSTMNSISESELEKEVRGAAMKVLEDANNSNIAGLKSAHLNSPKFSKFGPRIAKRQNVESTNKTETEHFSSITDSNFIWEDLKIDIFGDVAVTTFYSNSSFIKNNSRVKGKGRGTLVFLRTEEGWKIIHEHSSPFNE